MKPADLRLFPKLPSVLMDWVEKKSRSGHYVELFLHHGVSRETGFRNSELYEEFAGRECAASLRILDSSGREGLSHLSFQADPNAPWERYLETLWDAASKVLPYSRLDTRRVAPLRLDRHPVRSVSKSLEFPDKPPSAFLSRLHTIAKRERCRVLQMQFSEGMEERTLLATGGIFLSDTQPCAALDMSLVAESGLEVQALGASMSSRLLKRLESEMPELAATASKRARRMLSAKSLPSGRMPVVLDTHIATDFVALIAETFCADTVQKGMAPWAGRLGERIAASSVSLVDDATLKDGVGSYVWDDEGMPGQTVAVIEKGVLNSFLYDLYTSRVDGTCSTGNASRSSTGALSVEPTNFYMKPGKMTEAALIRDTQTGLYLTELMGLHTVDMSTGDFSLAGAGFKIEKGKVSEPVNRFTVAGNVYDMLLKIDAVASDLRFYGSVAAPSFRVPSLNIGGGL